MAATDFYFRTAPSFVVIVTFLVTVLPAEATVCPPHCTCLFPMVECSKKGLTAVPENLPDWVVMLELSSNKISTIPDGALDGLPQLEELNLSDNELTEVNASVFRSLPTLKTLKLSFNKLTRIPVPPESNNITQIIIHHNLIRRINPDALLHLPKLRLLNLNFNQLQELRVGTFPEDNSLKQLLLNNNAIRYIENGSLSNLTTLEWLKLNKNQLRNLTQNAFGQLTRLRNLELGRNKFQRIEGLALRGLKNLQSLSLRHNQISELMDGAFYGLGKMQVLDLDYNSITAITKNWLYGLSELQELSLSHNQISTIQPDSWEVCDNALWELNLGDNELTSISQDTLKGLVNLEYLYLNNNKISFIEEGAFMDLAAVKTLEMGHNAITWTVSDMDSAFKGLASLNRLGLASNRISVLSDGAFMGLEHLKHLLLAHNEISSVQENAFAPLKQLEELQLNSTNLLCDCQLAWLPYWLRTAGFASSVTAKCAHPEGLKGKSVFDVRQENFTCLSSDVPKPVIISEPESPQIALRGGNISLECVAQTTTDLPVDVMWKKDSRKLPEPDPYIVTYANTHDGTLTKYTSTLFLSNVKDDDAGSYQCVASNSLGSSSSRRIDIQVHVFPTFTKTPEDMTVRARNRARLECAATGQPDPQISWQKDGGDDFPAARERRMQVLPGDAVFFIVDVASGDQGVYSCTATNAAGTIMSNATLTVLETPAFVVPMEPKVTTQDESTVFQCMASGSPEPTIVWLKDGNPLDVTERHFFTAQDQLLIIVNTQPSDAGKYTCVMQNALGMEKGTSDLTVIAREPQSGGVLDENSTTTGIIIISVVCCVVGTSLIWVVIIYKTRKKGQDYSSTPTDDTTLPGEVGEAGFHTGEKDMGIYSTHLGMTYEKYPSMEMNGGAGLPPSRLRGAAIFPSDIEDHPLIGRHAEMSDGSMNSRLPGSDHDVGGQSSSSPSTYSSHSTQSTTLLHTFHPQPSTATLYTQDFEGLDADSPHRVVVHAEDIHGGPQQVYVVEEHTPGCGEMDAEDTPATSCECPSSTFPRSTRSSPATSRGHHYKHTSLPRLPKDSKDSITTSLSSSSPPASPASTAPPHSPFSTSQTPQSDCAYTGDNVQSIPSYEPPPPPVPPHRSKMPLTDRHVDISTTSETTRAHRPLPPIPVQGLPALDSNTTNGMSRSRT